MPLAVLAVRPNPSWARSAHVLTDKSGATLGCQPHRLFQRQGSQFPI